MDNNFKLEIISPEKIVFSGDATSTTIPAYEGVMSILKNHIPIITFLRPGIIKIEKKDKNILKFFVQDGTVEFYNDILVVLSTSVMNIENLSKDSLDKLSKKAEEKLLQKDLTDHDSYILNHTLNTIKEIRS